MLPPQLLNLRHHDSELGDFYSAVGSTLPCDTLLLEWVVSLGESRGSMLKILGLHGEGQGLS
jgi:hypothetical protein